MIAATLLLVAGAADVSKTQFVEHFGGGRYVCRLATRREYLSEVWIQFTRDGLGKVLKGDDFLKFSVNDAGPLTVGKAELAGTTTARAVRFRTGSTQFSMRVYNRPPMPAYLFLTATRDADAGNDMQHETASGFCHPVVPMAAPLQVKTK